MCKLVKHKGLRMKSDFRGTRLFTEKVERLLDAQLVTLEVLITSTPAGVLVFSLTGINDGPTYIKLLQAVRGWDDWFRIYVFTFNRSAYLENQWQG